MVGRPGNKVTGEDGLWTRFEDSTALVSSSFESHLHAVSECGTCNYYH